MARLDALRSQLSDVHDVQLEADGYALWMVWQGTANPVVVQTLEDYGGFKVAEAADQSLWFFLSSDALLAAARLAVWSRFNPLPLEMLIFSARLITSRSGACNLVTNEAFWQQSVTPALSFRVRVNNSLAKIVETSPGLALKKEEKAESGIDPSQWSLLEADPRLPYQSPLSWYAVLRPVGNPHDKALHMGWRDFFPNLEAVLQRNKFRFSMHDIFLMFPLDSLRQIKLWCKDFFSLIDRLREEAPQQYWPCVMVIVDRNGLSLNGDLPHKINVEWEHLVPDYPHMTLRNAVMLGEEFAAHEVRFAPSKHHPDDWVSVSLRSEDDDGNTGGSLPQLIPVSLVFGTHQPCFYCGQRSHTTQQCPSRSITPGIPDAWPRVAQMNFSDMREGVTQIDTRLSSVEDPEERILEVPALLSEDSHMGTMLKAFYDITWPVQLRAVEFFWRARNKDLKKAAKTLVSEDSSPLWDCLRSFRRMTNDELDVQLKELSVKNSKDFRYLTMRGFWAAERGEYDKAEKFWKEAERLSPHPIVQAWHGFLQARALECMGAFTAAGSLYDQIARTCPGWYDAEYRRVVAMVKNGFTTLALHSLTSLIERSGHFFNRALIDPELDRGYIQILSTLHALWVAMEMRAREEEMALLRIRDELGTWFLPDNIFAGEIAEKIEKILSRASVKNYVNFQMLVTGRARVDREIQAHVLGEARDYKNTFKRHSQQLKKVHEESAWFPFPKALLQFNMSYNEGVANNNWALKANLHTPESFRKAQMLVEQETERIKKLEGRLNFLRIVRDTTLFILTMLETFLWLEMIGLVLVFGAVPLAHFYSDELGISAILGDNAAGRWMLQKALLFILTGLSIAVAALRTLFSFERIRDRLLEKAKLGLVKPGKRK